MTKKRIRKTIKEMPVTDKRNYVVGKRIFEQVLLKSFAHIMNWADMSKFNEKHIGFYDAMDIDFYQTPADYHFAKGIYNSVFYLSVVADKLSNGDYANSYIITWNYYNLYIKSSIDNSQGPFSVAFYEPLFKYFFHELRHVQQYNGFVEEMNPLEFDDVDGIENHDAFYSKLENDANNFADAICDEHREEISNIISMQIDLFRNYILDEVIDTPSKMEWES